MVGGPSPGDMGDFLQVDRYALLVIGVVGKSEVTVHRLLSGFVLKVVVLCHLSGHSYIPLSPTASLPSSTAFPHPHLTGLPTALEFCVGCHLKVLETSFR